MCPAALRSGCPGYKLDYRTLGQSSPTQGGRAANQWVLPHHHPEKLCQEVNDV